MISQSSMLELVEELRARAPENADAIGVRFNANLMLKAGTNLSGGLEGDGAEQTRANLQRE